jgi:hypothetical protein
MPELELSERPDKSHTVSLGRRLDVASAAPLVQPADWRLEPAGQPVEPLEELVSMQRTQALQEQ